jgi:glycine cleavage system H protein
MPVRVDPNCRYTTNHEWLRVEGDQALLGISDYAQQQLSDIVYVELPEVGTSFAQGDVFAVVESVKAASDCYMPAGGEVLEINEELDGAPEVVNTDPYGQGWFVKLRLSDPAELESLMDAAAYQAFAEKALEEGEH